MYKCKQHIHELFWAASRFLKKIICNELYLCTRNKDGIRRILNCKCTGDFWLLCIAQRISSSISALIWNMQSWLCLLCSSYFSLQQSGLESVRRACCRLRTSPGLSLWSCCWLRSFAMLCYRAVTQIVPPLPLSVLSSLTHVLVAWPDLPASGLWLCTWFYFPPSSRLEDILQVRRTTGMCVGWAAEGREPEG